MIQTETFTIGEREFVRTYSDAGMKIHGGFPEADYDEATDPAELSRTYIETDIPIDTEYTEETKATEMVDALLGE